MRTSLKTRVFGEWSVFEAAVFNATSLRDVPDHLYFSKRLEAADAMLQAFDLYVWEQREGIVVPS